MTDDFTTEALHYLLDELPPARRHAFERLLARDAVAAAALKDCADALAAFALATAPAPPALSSPERAVLAQTMLASPLVRPSTRQRVAASLRRLAWPLAAALLLGLNLAQWFWPHLDVAPTNRTAAPADAAADRTLSAATGPRASAAPEVAPSGIAPDPDSALAPTDAATRDDLDRLDALRREQALLEQARDRLAAEYHRILQRLAPLADTPDGVGRLAAMELVDADSYARGDRKGLVNLARELLTSPGLIAIDPLPGPGLPGGASTATPVRTGPQPAPYAWSVYDEQQNQGYLNLYHLPPVPADQTLQLWFKPAGAEIYQPLGEVPPQLHGRSGSVYYRLPDGVAPPTEVLITREPRLNPPPAPTGPIILRGP